MGLELIYLSWLMFPTEDRRQMGRHISMNLLMISKEISFDECGRRFSHPPNNNLKCVDPYLANVLG